MYSHQITYFPAIGKGPELRPILEERVRQRQSEGVRASLTTVVYGGEAPAFRANMSFEDLAALQVFRDRIAGAPLAATPSLMRHAVRPELYEILLPATQAGFTPRYIQRLEITPQMGKAAAVRELVTERARMRNSEGTPAAVSVAVTSQGPAPFVLALIFDSLSGIEKFRARNQADKSFETYVAKISAVTTGTSSSILEVLIPFQPR
jgi:hypothetical protein